jgi:hypothetical protein
VAPERGRDHFGRQVEEAGIEAAHEHDGPFGEPGGLGDQGFVLHHLEALGEGEVVGFRADRLGALPGIDHHEGLAQPGRVVLEAAHGERRRRHEAVAAGLVAGRDAVDRDRHGLAVKRAHDRMQRAHPAQGPGAPAHRLGPGEAADDVGHEFGDDLGCFPPGLRDLRHEKAALLVLDFRAVLPPHAGRAQEALDGLGRGIDARAFALLGGLRRDPGEALHRQHQPARARMALGALIRQPGIDQIAGDQRLEIGRGAGLHARRDLLGEQFEQQLRHRPSAPRRRPWSPRLRRSPWRVRGRGRCRPGVRSPR